MPRKRRILIGAGPTPITPVRVAWFEDECRMLIRGCRTMASQATDSDPRGVRETAKVIISRVRFMLHHVRARPELAPQFWNVLMIGYSFNEARFWHHWGETLAAMKRQRQGSRRGAVASLETRSAEALKRVGDVLIEAAHLRRRPQDGALSERAFSRTVSQRLNRKVPAPEKRYTPNTVRKILRAQHFFR